MTVRCKKLFEKLERIEFLSSDENSRAVHHYAFDNVVCVGENLFYPNVKLLSISSKEVHEPLEERVMSLLLADEESVVDFDESYDRVVESPVFFFIYNTDNYYHFLYDSLPHVYSYLSIREKVPETRLLMSYPNSSKPSHYKFVIEALDLLGIPEESIEIVTERTLYRRIYVSSSYTHGKDSNTPPRKEVHELLQSMGQSTEINLPRKIYVSRRSWLHGDYSNIGTDYTSRRRMVNENKLVESLKSFGIVEVFTETLSTKEKIQLFREADVIVGSIGGGMANCLFSRPDTKVVVIVSPTFLDVNARFKHCFDSVKVTYATNCSHVESSSLKKYMRVKAIDGRVGEIVEIHNDTATVMFAANKVAGWSKSMQYEETEIHTSSLTPLDGGLNSEWESDVEEILRALR